MSSETTRPNERLLVMMHRATFDEQQTAYLKQSADVATEPRQRAVVESTVDSPELVQPTGQ